MSGVDVTLKVFYNSYPSGGKLMTTIPMTRRVFSADVKFNVNEH